MKDLASATAAAIILGMFCAGVAAAQNTGPPVSLPRIPSSCQFFWAAQKQCIFSDNHCDKQAVESLHGQCLSDGGNPGFGPPI